ncbi:hypothetical protein [Nitrosomonas supralitoralis]|uniref:Uncharacterized protein n=1 Tax=Nitrosomonas supralitoralis TaxID=2116706 RepID=A0A2P7NYH5_9PROT|nr:hypothetical protein [Nitrosomonas supralitoralis]PSJ18521.1 hypothetical protein C7H79_02760 [Nitrosomonas supralitoralis]
MSNQLSPSDLMPKTSGAMESIFDRAIRIIDSRFGEGYSKANPDLITVTMNSFCQDGKTATTISERINTRCSCGINYLVPVMVRDTLQDWIMDHPGHSRKEHVFMIDTLKWLADRAKGGRE